MSEVQPHLPGVPPTARPGRSKPAIMRRAAEQLGIEVLALLKDPRAKLDDVVDDLLKVMGSRTDGYDLAKQLERQGYDPDAEPVEILDTADSYVRNAHDDAVKEWVKAEDITLDLPLSAVVTTRHGDGPIASLYPETAKYVVAVTPEQRASPGSGYILHAEDVTPVDPQSAEAALEVAHG
ncbi:hypothetical protein [Beijerinckia sp. L45]|uniref:hypothetical protein n=1 Tax=Beijerinckia sp. L45 TaxID=1641855 RepID=UPI00131D6628|nr:hypothetical protein [Beijerinckia sp. L45]